MCSNWCYTKRPGTSIMCIQKSSWHVNFPSNYTIKPMTRNIQQKRRSGVGVSNGPDSGSKFYEWTDSGGQVFKTVRQKKSTLVSKYTLIPLDVLLPCKTSSFFLSFCQKKWEGKSSFVSHHTPPCRILNTPYQLRLYWTSSSSREGGELGGASQVE